MRYRSGYHYAAVAAAISVNSRPLAVPFTLEALAQGFTHALDGRVEGVDTACVETYIRTFRERLARNYSVPVTGLRASVAMEEKPWRLDRLNLLSKQFMIPRCESTDAAGLQICCKQLWMRPGIFSKLST